MKVGEVMAYIDADKFAEEICNFPAIDEDSANAVISLLRRQPTAEVEEVVRCKDCKHYRSYGKTSLLVDGKNIKAGWCQRRMRYDEEHRMLPDDFCSYGEKKRR